MEYNSNMKRIKKSDVPQRILKLFSPNEKARWLVNDGKDIESIFLFICIAYLNYELVFPFLVYDYQVLSGIISINTNSAMFIVENLLAFLGLFFLYVYIEYNFFTKIILSTKKLYIQRFFKIIQIDKENISNDTLLINYIIPYFNILKTNDGKYYFFPSSSICSQITRRKKRDDKIKPKALIPIKSKQEPKKKNIIHNPIVAILILFLIMLSFCYPLSLLSYEFSDILLPAKTFKHNILYRSVKALDKLNFQDSKLTVLLRNELYEHYFVMYNSFDDKKYNAIAPFAQILDELACYDKKQEANIKKIKDKNGAVKNYIKHEIKVTNEISKILKEYEHRDEYYLAGIENSGWRSKTLPNLGYNIPDRLTFYFYLALFYQKTNDIYDVEELKNILFTYDKIFMQEKNKNSVMYKKINESPERYQLNLKIFTQVYSCNILRNELENNSENFCSNKEIFDKFSQVYKTNDDYEKMMDTIVTACNYEVAEN